MWSVDQWGPQVLTSCLANGRGNVSRSASERAESLSIPSWWRQCTDNAGKEGLYPLLVYRRNHEPAMVVMEFMDLLDVVKND